MDKLVFNVPKSAVSNEGIVVRIDAEAAAMLLDISDKTGMDKKIYRFGDDKVFISENGNRACKA